MKKLIVTLIAMCACAIAQDNRVQQYFYNGTNVQYSCMASANVAQTAWSKGEGTLTSIGVSSNVGTVTTASAHNLFVGAWVTVSGSTVAALNTSYAVTSVPSSTTFTIATSGVSDATYNNNPLNVVTNSPLLNAAVWYVTVYHYDVSGNLDGSYPGGGPLSMNYRAKCSSRATY